MRLTPRRRTGIECSASGIKLVSLDRRGTSVVVTHADIEEESYDSWEKGDNRPGMEAARRLLARHDLTRYRVTLVPQPGTETVFVTVPRMSRSDLDRAICLQARKERPADKPEPLLAHVDSDLLRERVGSVVGVADWDEVKPWCRLVEGHRGIVEDVTVRACAYESLARVQGWARKGMSCLVADLGAFTSSFYVISEGRTCFVRQLPLGGNTLTQALTTEVSDEKGTFRLSEQEAEDFKIAGRLSPEQSEAPRGSLLRRSSSGYGGREPRGTAYSAEARLLAAKAGLAKASRADAPGPGSNAGAVNPLSVAMTEDKDKRFRQFAEALVRPVLERVAAEILRSLQFFKENSGRGVDRVLLTGGSAGFGLLKAHLRSALSVPVEDLDAFAGLRFSSAQVEQAVAKNGQRLSVAAGLALADELSISLLPSSLRAHKRLSVYAPAAVALLLVFGFFPLLAGVVVRTVRIQKLRPEIEKARQELAAADAQRRQLGTLEAEMHRTQTSLSKLEAAVSSHPLWSGVLNSLADAVPESITLTSLLAEPGNGGAWTVALRAVVPTTARGFNEALAECVSAMSASVFFTDVKVSSAKAARGEKTLGSFELRCNVKH